MQTQTLDDIPMLAQALDLQRTLSASKDIGELVFTFVDRFHRHYGVSTVMGLRTEGLEGGAFRVMDFIEAAAGLSPQALVENAKWDLPPHQVPVEQGGLIGQLLQTRSPTLARGIDPAEDPVLARYIQTPCDLVTIPVFHEGVLDEWFLVFREPGAPHDPEHTRLLLSALNMFSRGIHQLRLHDDIASLNQQLDAKLREVAKVQRSILPQQTPAYDTVDIAVDYRPCDLAGGDYYDFRTFDDGAMGVVIADVSGHGPGAAVVMAMLRTAISINRVLDTQAGDVIATINRFMWDGLAEGTFVTACFLKLHPETGQVGYASAGHWPALVRKHDGRVVPLDESSGLPIGIVEDMEVTSGTYQLDPGDTVLLYTDGILEAFNPSDETFGLARLTQTLEAHTPTTARCTLDAVSKAVNAHTQGRKPDDDQCVLALRYIG